MSVTMKITDDFCYILTTKLTLFTVSKDKWKALVSPSRIYCMHSGMAKGTSWAEAMSNSEKIKPVALAIVELHESEGIRQAGRQ